MRSPAEQTSTPLVSVIMASYNYAHFIERAIESLFAQDWPSEALDVIVVDDGSTDGTAEVVESYRDRVRYVYKENGGLVSALNRGLEEARGRYISFLDADDEYLPHKTRAQVELLEARPELGLVYGDLNLIGEQGQLIAPSMWDWIKLTPVRGKAFGRLLRRNVVTGGTIMFRAQLRDRVYPIPSDARPEDWYIAMRIAESAELDYIPEPVYRYRYHGENMNLGARGEKQLSLVRGEVPFRRTILTQVTPLSVDADDLLRAFDMFESSAAHVAKHSNVTIDEVLAVTDQQKVASNAALLRGHDHLGRGEDELALFAFVAASAHDPYSHLARAGSELARKRMSPPARPSELADALARIVVGFADELISDGALLARYLSTAKSDETLVVVGGRERFEELARAIDAGSRSQASAVDPDVLAVGRDLAAIEALSVHASAVHTNKGPSDALGLLPRWLQDGARRDDRDPPLLSPADPVSS